MRKLVLGMILSLFVFGVAEANAMPRYEPYCPFSGCGAVSDDGKRAIFTFDEPLDMLYPGSGPDVIYERVGGLTKALFEYPEGKRKPTRLLAVSDDARRAIVQTRSPLSPQDTDGSGDDFYAIQDGVPELISWDPARPESASESRLGYGYSHSSDDARTVYFLKNDTSPYCTNTLARDETGFRRLEIGCFQAIEGTSRDGKNVFLNGEIDDPTSGSRWQGNMLRLRDGQYKAMTDFEPVVTDSNCSLFVMFGDATADGETMLYTTNQQVDPTDVDDDYDVYVRRPDGSHELLTDSAKNSTLGCMPAEGKESDHAIGLSDDGERALFTTHARLSPDDTDSSLDAYLHVRGEQPKLITTGPTDDGSEVRNPALGDSSAGWPVLAWRIDASDDLTTIAFDTSQRLVAEDTDNAVDVYMWHDGETELVSTGPTATGEELNAKLFGISNDGSRVAFSTMESLVAVDMDNRMDIYSRTTGQIGRATDEGEPSATPASLTASVAARKSKRRTSLLSAESIAPRMKVIGKLRVSGRTVKVKLRCPKTEETGPCRGKVQVRLGSSRGSARFRVVAGKAKSVTVRMSRSFHSKNRKATVSIKAWDRLGNTSKGKRKVALR